MFSWNEDGKLKLMIIAGTRPEIIRLSSVIKRSREYLDTCVVYTNQNYDPNLSLILWEDLGLGGPDVLLDVAGKNLGETCGNIISQTFDALNALRPDACLVLGDTNSCLSAMNAKRLHIPVFHMEAGNRCKDECLPEETNRRMVDVIADVNLPYSEAARRYLIECGMPMERTFVTGSPMAEVLTANLGKIESSDILVRMGLERERYILLSAHREENLDSEKNFNGLFSAINAIARKYDVPVLYSCHPRAKRRLEETAFELDPRVRISEPLNFSDYNNLQLNSLAVISDSGTLPEEASFYISIGSPIAAISIRTSTERPEAIESGDFVIAGITENELLQAADMAISMKQAKVAGRPCPDYVDCDVSAKVVRIVQSYTHIVNRMVWRKDQ